MTDAKLAVGDEVRVFDVNGHRHGQPADGYAGRVVRVGTKLVRIAYGRGHSKVFRLDTRCTNDAYGHQSYQTVAEAEARMRYAAALAVIREHGFELRSFLDRPPLETVETIAAALRGQEPSDD